MFSAIILAAGNSTRMAGVNKQLAKIGDTPVFIMSALAFERSQLVSEIILTAPAEDVSRYEKMARNFGVTKLKLAVAGGSTRFLSVRNALEAVSKKCEYIAVHDGARPLITTTDIDRVLNDAVKYEAAIAAVPATDTVKRAAANGFVEDTPPREKLYYAQTPQAFKKKLYLDCIGKLGDTAQYLTDDSMLVEKCGGYVRITEITACNMKITRPEDLVAADAIYSGRNAVKII
jgi:2-C-methyl-D-erythritol 4-phosphate cytidylyltransferase